MTSNYTYWIAPDGREFEVHYQMSHGEIADYSLYPKPDFDLSREQEREIFELIYDAEMNDD